MRKAVAILVVLALMLLTLAGCSSGPQVAKVGIGHVTSIAKSTDLTTAEDGTVKGPMAEVDTVIAVVAFDKDGKVMKATIDTAQTKVNFDQTLQVTSDLKAAGKTKVELGSAYGLAKASKIGKEWNQQIAELEKWMVGKTVDQITGMKQNAGKADVPELTSLVTVSVGDYLAAVAEASKNAVAVTGVTTLGLGHVISTAKSVGYSKTDAKEVLPMAEVDTTISGTAFDKDGKVVKEMLDVAQTKVNFDATGKVTSDKTAAPKTKVELGSAYGMAKNSKIGKEWSDQAAAFAQWAAGKTADQIKALKVTTDASHPGAPDVPELTSTVTVSVSDFVSAIVEAKTNALSAIPASK